MQQDASRREEERKKERGWMSDRQIVGYCMHLKTREEGEETLALTGKKREREREAGLAHTMTKDRSAVNYFRMDKRGKGVLCVCDLK